MFVYNNTLTLLTFMKLIKSLLLLIAPLTIFDILLKQSIIKNIINYYFFVMKLFISDIIMTREIFIKISMSLLCANFPQNH